MSSIDEIQRFLSFNGIEVHKCALNRGQNKRNKAEFKKCINIVTNVLM